MGDNYLECNFFDCVECGDIKFVSVNNVGEDDYFICDKCIEKMREQNRVEEEENVE